MLKMILISFFQLVPNAKQLSIQISRRDSVDTIEAVHLRVEYVREFSSGSEMLIFIKLRDNKSASCSEVVGTKKILSL